MQKMLFPKDDFVKLLKVLEAKIRFIFMAMEQGQKIVRVNFYIHIELLSIWSFAKSNFLLKFMLTVSPIGNQRWHCRKMGWGQPSAIMYIDCLRAWCHNSPCQIAVSSVLWYSGRRFYLKWKWRPSWSHCRWYMCNIDTIGLTTLKEVVWKFWPSPDGCQMPKYT